MTLQERLRVQYNLTAMDEFEEAADALDAKDARIKELEWLLSEAMEFVESDYTGTRNKDLTGRNLIHRAREALK